MTLWLLVSRAKYELPLIVADSIETLAQKTGTSKATIRSGISKRKHLGIRSRFARVDIEEDEDEYSDEAN